MTTYYVYILEHSFLLPSYVISPLDTRNFLESINKNRFVNMSFVSGETDFEDELTQKYLIEIENHTDVMVNTSEIKHCTCKTEFTL